MQVPKAIEKKYDIPPKYRPDKKVKGSTKSGEKTSRKQN